MCRIEEKIYVGTDGVRAVYPETFHCEHGRRHRRICTDARVHTREYRTGSSREPTSSPIASSPLTPSGPGFNTRVRRPSMSSRPSTKDGPVTVKPEIVIEIGSSKKGKGKSYPTVSISTKGSHRTFSGSGSNVDSLGSAASSTLHTGYPDVTSLPFSSNYPRSDTLLPRPHHHRNKSDDSYMDQTPPLYMSSDYDSPPSLATTVSSNQGPIIHNSQRHVPSPISTTRGQSGSPANPYRTTVVTPSGVYDEASDFNERSHRSGSSHASSAAPEITDRGDYREKRRAEKRRQQEAEASTNAMQEESRRVHFEPAERRPAAHEQRRSDGREQSRQERKEREAEAAKKAARDTRPQPSANTSKPSRRASVRMNAAEAATQQQLIAAEAQQMERERMISAAIEREEQLQQPTLLQRQQDPAYYDPRGDRTTQPALQRSTSRRNSLSQDRPDLTSAGNPRVTGPNQPRHDRGPPVSFPNSFNARVAAAPPRERRPSQSQPERPPNPFVSPVPQPADPWDVRNMRDALPSARGPQVGHNFPQQASQRLHQAFQSGEKEEGYHGKRR